jgi:glycosyltransferase involved in cell wall biosynthesis
MRIALLHYTAQPIVGGVETVMQQHGRLMAAAGHGVRIIAGRGARVDDSVEFVSLPLVDSLAPEVLAVKRQLDEGAVPADFGQLSSRIETQLRGAIEGMNWVFAHNVCSLNKNLPLTAAIRRIFEGPGAPQLGIWHHDLAWTTPRYASELHDGYPWELLRSDFPGSVHVTVSKHRQAEISQLMGIPPERVLVIPNGIDPYRFLRMSEAARDLARRLGLLEAAPCILLPARITPRKNIELALRVLSRLRTSHPGARLLVTGPIGPHNAQNSAYLKSVLALRAQLGLDEAALFLSLGSHAPISDEVVSSLYSVADALLLPSTEEGFGIPILESGLARIPVFCSDIAPLRELGAADVTYFPPDGDANQVAEAIGRALDASSSYSLRKRVLRDYTWERIYLRFLEPLLAGHLQ